MIAIDKNTQYSLQMIARYFYCILFSSFAIFFLTQMSLMHMILEKKNTCKFKTIAVILMQLTLCIA